MTARTGFIGQQKGRAPVVDYNEINLLESDDVKQEKLAYWICKQVGEALIAAYPKRQWGVMVEDTTIIIVCPSLSLTKGYYLHMNGDSIHGLQERAKRAAGEILERYNVTRGRVTDEKMFDHLPQVRDEVISADAAPEPIQKRVHV